MQRVIKHKRPDPLASFSEKKTNEYGIQVAMMIARDWFGGTGIINGSCEYHNRREKIRNNRLFVRGEADPKYYKDYIQDGDNLEYLNIDWKQGNWGQKYCLLVSNGISDENYKLDIRSIDKFSAIQKKKKEDFYKKYMQSKQMLEVLKSEIGLDLTPNGFIPEDEEEMQFYMEMKDRPKIEIAEESLIDFVKSSNDWDNISYQTRKDIVENGLIVARVWIDKNDGVKIQYVDIENYIHSYVKRNDFSDKYYEGFVDTITLSDLRRESGFSEETLRKIAQTYGSTNNNIAFNYSYDTCPFEELLDYKITVLRFAYKTSKTIKYKTKLRKGKVVKASKKSDTYIAPEREDTSEIGKVLDTWFEGNHIVGTEFIYDYKECENLYDDVMNKALSPFITFATNIYENRLDCFLDNIKVPATQLQLIHLQLQKLSRELKPDLINIDIDTLAELDDGKGGTKQQAWETALTLLNVKGVVFTKRIDMGEQGIKDQPAVRPSAIQQGSGITQLLNLYAFYVNMIRENTGVNGFSDGTMSQDALVGVTQMAQLTKNTITKNIVDTTVAFNKKICEVVSSRLHTIYKYKTGKHLREMYNNIVSKHLVDSIEVMKDRHLHEFGFIFEMTPTTEEIQEFRQALTIAMQEGSIDVEIKIEAERVAKSNIKLANQYLMFERRKRIKQKQQEQMMLAEHKSQSDAMAAQAKVQAETKSYKIKKGVDLQALAQEYKMKLMYEKALMDMRQPTEDKEFQQEVYLKQIETFGTLNREKFKQDRTDLRTEKQASQQSRMIEQRNNNEPAVDFENNFSELLSEGL